MSSSRVSDSASMSSVPTIQASDFPPEKGRFSWIQSVTPREWIPCRIVQIASAVGVVGGIVTAHVGIASGAALLLGVSAAYECGSRVFRDRCFSLIEEGLNRVPLEQPYVIPEIQIVVLRER